MLAGARTLHTELQGSASGACVVAGASCRHIHSGGGQGRKQEPGQLRISVGALAAGMLMPLLPILAMGTRQWRLVMRVRLGG